MNGRSPMVEPFKLNRNKKNGPEAKIQEEIIQFLKVRNWFVKVIHGNMYQSGMPDLFATHHDYHIRLIEIKNPVSFSFTPAQTKEFPLLIANGAGVWVLTAATEKEYAKLWQPSNYYQYLELWRHANHSL